MAMYIREVPCEICDTVEDVNNFCLNCKQKFCDSCKNGHLRAVISKHHKFVPIGDSLLPSSQKNEICSKHNEENLFYCKTCDKLACSVCLTELHKKHDFSLINQLVSSAQKEINDKIEIKEKEISAIQNDLNNHEAAVQQCRQYSTDSSDYIKKTIKGWVDDLKSFEDELIESTHNDAEKEAEKIERKAEELKGRRANLIREIQDVKVKVRASSDASLLGQKSGIISQIDAIVVPKTSKIDPVLPPVILCQSSKEQVRHFLQNTDPGSERGADQTAKSQPQITAPPIISKAQKHKLKSNLGVIKKIHVSESVYDIAPVSESKAWIGIWINVMLVKTDGQILLQHPHGNTWLGTSVTSASSDDALYVSNNTVISRIDQTGKVSEVVDLGPKRLNCIRLSRHSDIIYAATDMEIVKLSLDGTLIGSINCSAIALTELTDNRLVAIDRQKETVLLDKDGNVTSLSNAVKWSWGGFYTALSSDSCDRIVVGHPGGKQLQVYELRGEKLELQRKYIVSMEGRGIYGLTVDRQGRLWIGTHNGEVLVVKYCE